VTGVQPGALPICTVGDIASIGRAYRTGPINGGQHVEAVAIINFGGPDPGIAHDYAHAFWVEDRMRRSQGGTTPNRVMWFGVTPLIGDPRWANESLTAMDRWLTAVERDRSAKPLAQKVADNRPDDVTDRCDNVPGVLEVPGAEGDERECVLPDSLQLRLSTPREQAGDDVLNDRVACRLRPLDRTDYDFLLVPPSDAQWATLQEVVPHGGGESSEPGRGFQDNETWLRYGDRKGEVVYGGPSLPAPGGKQASGWQSRSFKPPLQQ